MAASLVPLKDGHMRGGAADEEGEEDGRDWNVD